MNTRSKFQSFAIGEQITVERAIEVADIDSFAQISGDSSAIHLDASVAVRRGFSGRVAHGLLLGAWVSAIIGTQLPGDCGLLQAINLNFRAPVVPPDLLRITVEVLGKSEAVSQLKLGIRIVRADGVLAVSGEARSIISET